MCACTVTIIEVKEVEHHNEVTKRVSLCSPTLVSVSLSFLTSLSQTSDASVIIIPTSILIMSMARSWGLRFQIFLLLVTLKVYYLE